MLGKKYARGNVPLDGGMALPCLDGGWWLRRGMILFVSYSQWARNQPSTFKIRMMTIFSSYILIILTSLMHMMFTRTSGERRYAPPYGRCCLCFFCVSCIGCVGCVICLNCVQCVSFPELHWYCCSDLELSYCYSNWKSALLQLQVITQRAPDGANGQL